MTRILHVLDHSLPLHSGYTFRTRAIVKAQIAAGLDVRCITGLRHNAGAAVQRPDETFDDIRFARVSGASSGPAGLRELREVRRLEAGIRSLAQGWRPDVIHAHSPALCGLAALGAARALGVPMVYEIRAFWEDAAVGNRTGREGSLRYRATRALETHVARRADSVLTICEGLRSDLAARGIPPGRIGVMPNGVDLALFGEPPARDDALGRELGIAPGAPVIGYIGSFYDYEGLDDLIAAMPAVRQRHPAARLLLVGAGAMEAAWRERADALGEPSTIIFTGRVPHDQVERYYSLIDVLAYPRKAQRLTELVTPLKPLEAMAQRRLVAASDVGGHRELITHQHTGILFEADNPAACADALADLLDTPESWDALREAGARHVRERHDWARNAERYLSLYHHLITRRNKPAGPGASAISHPAHQG